ncbi:MAG: AGE family epimerase/isomerase [Prevotella sp.]
MRDEMQDVLTGNILPFWLNNMQDTGHGGFYGQMRGDMTLVRDADKGGILNARILWSFAAAYRLLRRPEYLAAARRSKDYIVRHFIDPLYGGSYWSVDCHGEPKDTKKQFYVLGFMLYGMSEYVRATIGEARVEDSDWAEALQLCFHLFDAIEEHSLDKVNNGYIEAQTREWGEIADMRLSALDANYPKSQNTHLHIMEPYTNLLRCLKELEATGHEVDPHRKEQVTRALRNIIGIFTDHILNPDTHHLDLFFDNDWTHGAGWLESYGHDIECSWLIHEAALVLDDAEVLGKVEPIVVAVAKASEKGLNSDGSMTHEANLDTGHVDDDRHWWVQAEAVVGFFNIYQHFADSSALDKALACWRYIRENLIDYEHGEWYWSRNAKGELNTRDDHAGFWKCPYHNSRMCLEVMERVGKRQSIITN